MTNFAPHFSTGHDFYLYLLCEDIFQLTICHAVNLLHMTICHMEKFLHMTDFFSTSTARGACDKYEVCKLCSLSIFGFQSKPSFAR